VSRDPIISGFRHSVFGDARVACTSESRVAISRVNGSRRSSGGQVARDPEKSDFGVSAFGVPGGESSSSLKSRPAISRINWSRRSGQGHVA
jgi:hypothetical protein